MIVKGKAIPTKDGYYIGEYVLRDEDVNIEIANKEVEIEADIVEETNNSQEQTEITQHRAGTTKYLVNIKAIKIQ